MKTKYASRSVLLAIGALLASPGVTAAHLKSMDGHGPGNGGGLWTCYEDASETKTRWSKLVDLYESEKEFDQTPIALDPSKFGNDPFIAARKVFEDRIKPIDLSLYQQLIAQLDDVASKFDVKDVKLRVLDDSLYRIEPDQPRECKGGVVKYVQLANYTDYGKILVRKASWEDPKTSFLTRAALIGHEAIYALVRAAPFNDTNSVRARELNGSIFSNMSLDELNQKIGLILYGKIVQKVEVEKKVISTGETLYYVKGTNQLAAPTTINGPNYHFNLPMGATVMLAGDYILSYVEAPNYQDSWILLFGQRVSIVGPVSLDPQGKPLGAIQVGATFLDMGGGKRKIPQDTKFFFKDGAPYCMGNNAVQELYLGIVGSKQSSFVRFAGGNCIHLDPEGYVTQAVFRGLRISVEGKPRTWDSPDHSGYDIGNGTFEIPGETQTFEATLNGYPVLTTNSDAFCAAKGFSNTSAGFTGTSGRMTTYKHREVWDPQTGGGHRVADAMIADQIWCAKAVTAKVVD